MCSFHSLAMSKIEYKSSCSLWFPLRGIRLLCSFCCEGSFHPPASQESSVVVENAVFEDSMDEPSFEFCLYSGVECSWCGENHDDNLARGHLSFLLLTCCVEMERRV